MEPLIPGLIDDLVRECLSRIPFHKFPIASAVCKSWKSEITQPNFRRFRKLAGLTRPVIVLAQVICDDPNSKPIQGVKRHSIRPGYRFVLSEPEGGIWTELPAIPGLPEGLPMFCAVVVSGSNLVVIGGLDPVTLWASGCVYVYNFLTGMWRRGSDMPGVQRSFFGCGSDCNRVVVVAGGHDEDKNALRSALMYDVVEDKWVPLPDMASERDECKVIFQSGKFHVIGGYPTDRQGLFERSMEMFDPSMWQWGPIDEEFLESSVNPNSCVASSNGRVYTCTGHRAIEVAVQLGDRWQVVAKVPDDMATFQWVASCGNKLVVIGSSKYGEPCSCYMLDLKDRKWSKIDMPIEYHGQVQSSCVLEL